MPKELKLFSKDDLLFNEKFYKLMDLLISNQPYSKFESLFFLTINYLQILSSFYSEQISIFNPNKSKSDSILNTIEKILRIKDLFRNNNKELEKMEYGLFIVMILAIIYFLFICLNTSNTSIYSFNKIFINYFIKIFLYYFYNIILDISFSHLCFGFSENNPNFNQKVICRGKDKILIILVSIIFIIMAFSLRFLINIYYNEPFFLSYSSYSKMITNYELFMDLNLLFNSLLLTQVYFLTKYFFIFYNLVASIFLCIYYIRHYVYYDLNVHILSGMFHLIYVWTSIFCIICSYVDFNEKGIIYIIISIIVGSFYFNIHNKIENDIFYNIPLSRLTNSYYILYFLKAFTEKIIKYEEKNENKVFVSAVLQILIDECPNERCADLIAGDIYLPSENKWCEPKKRNLDDIVFLKYFVVVLFNYIIYNQYSCPEIFFNLSIYYLKVMGNYCEAMYYCQKLNEMKLKIKQRFVFERLKLKISEALVEKLKPPNEQNVSLENLNISMYYKYDDLSHNFIEEIKTDIELSLEFWKIFKRSLKDINFRINFDKIFKLTEKIQITKKNIEKMWNDLLKIYNGMNEYFQFYNEYIEQINNDDLKKRDLDSIKKKYLNLNEHLNNYYSILFNNDTGIMIANADKGKEGKIRLCNKRIESIFLYNNSELKELNVNKLMPKLYDKKHSKYIEKYFRVGYKKCFETKDFKTFGKDKNNSIIQLRLALKLFPILNYNVFFVALIIKENINDIILIDENFYIQGMSSKLMNILNINNNFFFQENNVPFYVICKKYINFYSISLGKKKKEPSHALTKKKTIFSDKEKLENMKKFEERELTTKIEEEEGDEIHENLEINENIELEFEIKLPQFLINYSSKKDYKPLLHMENTISILSQNHDKYSSSSEDESDSENNDNENELLVEDSSKINKELNLFYNKNIDSTPLPNQDFNPTFNNGSSSPSLSGTRKKNSLKSQLIRGYKKSEEEEIYNTKIEEYQRLFNEGKFEELEDLIDICNKESNLPEYKFNFTFDKYKFGDNELAYIIRCIDINNQETLSEEKSIELDSKAAKYKKEKTDSIKPLFELLEMERQEIINLPEYFLKLSLENQKFKELLEICKNDIINLSKIQGKREEEEVIEDENSSQTSHVGFDNGLVKKNRIQEIRSNLFNNVSNFYTLKYIKIIVTLIAILTIVFSFIYIIMIFKFKKNMKNVSLMNLMLHQTTLWTTELISIFISLKVLYLKKIGKIDYDYLNFETETIRTNDDFYEEMEKVAKFLSHNLTYFNGQIEMNIPHYIAESQLLSLYWDHINVSYINTNYARNNKIVDVSFPISVVQFLSNSINFLKNYNINNIDKLNFEDKNEERRFDYITHLIIENAYDNILPNLFIKIQKIPNVLTQYNNKKKVIIYLIIIIYMGLMAIICLIYFIMINLTKISMNEIIKKVTKIKLDKIEDIIKKIEIFNCNLKKFRDTDLISFDEQNTNEAMKDDFTPKKNASIDYSFNNINSISHLEEEDKHYLDEKLETLSSRIGFNIDDKKYYSLTVLKEFLIHCVLFSCLLCAFIIPINIISIFIIKNINQLLLIQNYIYGELINTSVNILELKCFIIECKNSTVLNFVKLKSMDNIQEVIKGLKNFKDIENFYNNKFLLNACDTAIDKNLEPLRYELCINDSFIASGNNTDNIMKIIENMINNIYKKDGMNMDKVYITVNGKNITYFRQLLFSDLYFQRVENVYYKYIFSVDQIFEESIKNSLHDYLKYKITLLIILILSLALIMVFYNISFLLITIPKLVYLLSVSRCVLKIIPSSVIINTPELETWIENKFFN